MDKIRVFFIDDHQTITELLFEIFQKPEIRDRFEVVGRAQDGREGLVKLKNNRNVDVVLLDMEMPGMNGLATTTDLKKMHPEIKVMILTMHNSWSLANKAIEHGASGYLLKQSGQKAIVAGIEKIHAGKIVIDQDIRAGQSAYKAPEFNPEDMQIIQLVMEEKTSTEIAAALVTKEVYVENRRREIISQMGCVNVVGLAKFALRNRLYLSDKAGTEKLSTPPVLRVTHRLNEQSQIDVFIIDDHEMIVDGLAAMLQNKPSIHLRIDEKVKNAPPIILQGYALTGTEALQKLETGPIPDIILMDYHLPDCSGPELIRTIRSRHPAVRIITLTLESATGPRQAALEAGASRYLIKSHTGKTEILGAIIDVWSEHPQQVQSTSASRPAGLNEKELKIIEMILAEKGSKEIADFFHSNINSIDHSRSRILEKLRVRNVVGLVKYAWENGLLH